MTPDSDAPRGYDLCKGRVAVMRREPVIAPGPLPETRSDLQGWVHEHLHLAPDVETALLAAIDAVFTRHERLWQDSKHEAIQALSSGFSEKMTRVKHELNAKDATVSSISRYFEQLVADSARLDAEAFAAAYERFLTESQALL